MASTDYQFKPVLNLKSCYLRRVTEKWPSALLLKADNYSSPVTEQAYYIIILDCFGMGVGLQLRRIKLKPEHSLALSLFIKMTV